jgi:hypothetical protein
VTGRGSVGRAGQGRQQFLSSRSQGVHRPEIEALPSNQASVQGDFQMATDAALLAFDDQAQVTDAQRSGFKRVTSFSEQEQDAQAGRVAQDLSLSSKASRFLVVGKLRPQRFGLAFVRVFRAQIGVSHA